MAKNILSEYHKKTHFKALCACSLDLSDSYKKKKINIENDKDNFKIEEKYNSFNTLYNRIMYEGINQINNMKYNSIKLYKK